MEKRREKKKKRHPIVGVTLLCTLLASLCAGALAWFQLNRYEAGLVEVCAVQQDSYVQLVLDQIRMRRDQKSRGEIEDILGSMDASSNKYWTFSRGQDMLFVKDVLETNKYKGFTTATYYVSDSARSFLEDIRVDRVSHAGIFIEDREYIASGGASGRRRRCLPSLQSFARGKRIRCRWPCCAAPGRLRPGSFWRWPAWHWTGRCSALRWTAT